MSWAAHHAAQMRTCMRNIDLEAMLPLFYNKSSSPAMIKHVLTIVQKSTNFLNPGQIPVTVFDQPLFAIAKAIQWNYQETHGEDKIVVMFGGLHIEMALWNTPGDFLVGSGWTEALGESGVSSTGTAESFLNVSHLMRTRYAH